MLALFHCSHSEAIGPWPHNLPVPGRLKPLKRVSEQELLCFYFSVLQSEGDDGSYLFQNPRRRKRDDRDDTAIQQGS